MIVSYLRDVISIEKTNNWHLNFSGTSLGDCPAKDLKSLIDTLKIDIKNLETSTEENSDKITSVGYPDDIFDADEETSDDHNDATTDTPSPLLDGHQVLACHI